MSHRQQQQQRVADAEEPKDLDVKERNSLYVTLNRFMEKAKQGKEPTDPKAVLARWAEAKGAKGDNKELAGWCFFKEWMADPTCATIRVTDEHVKESIRLDAISYHWQSRWQIKDTFHADTSPEGLEMADDVCLKAIESYQNPLYPDNPNWMMHLVPNTHVH